MKILQYSNYRIEVTPAAPWYLDKDPEKAHKSQLRTAEEIKKNILRHVDDIHSATVLYDATALCSHCYYPWEGDDQFPWCCEAAQKEWIEKNPDKQPPQEYLDSVEEEAVPEPVTTGD